MPPKKQPAAAPGSRQSARAAGSSNPRRAPPGATAGTVKPGAGQGRPRFESARGVSVRVCFLRAPRPISPKRGHPRLTKCLKVPVACLFVPVWGARVCRDSETGRAWPRAAVRRSRWWGGVNVAGLPVDDHLPRSAGRFPHRHEELLPVGAHTGAATGGSLSIWPRQIACSRRAVSFTVRHIGPMWSSDQESGTTPRVLTEPYVGFSPTIPQYAAGSRIEPLVSVVASGDHLISPVSNASQD